MDGSVSGDLGELQPSAQTQAKQPTTGKKVSQSWKLNQPLH